MIKGSRSIFYLFIIIVLGLQGCQALPAPNPIPQTGKDAAASAPAVEIRSVEVLRSADPQQTLLVVKAVLPDTCSRLGEAVVERQGQVFTVTLPGERSAGEVGCQAAPLSQDTVIHLSADSLASGNYVALVNGVVSSFRIANTNAVPAQLGQGGGEQAASIQLNAAGNQAAAGAAETGSAAVEAPAAGSAGLTPTAEPTPAVEPPASADTPASAGTPVEAALPSPTPVGEPAAPPLALAAGKDPASCVNKAAFYGTLTVPDGTPFAPGSKFTKTWLVMNVGSCTWGPGYQLVFAGGDALGAQQKVPMPKASPRQVVRVSVDMTAPIPPRSYESSWAIETPDGYVFGLGNPAVTPLTAKISVEPLPLGLPSGLSCGALRQRDMEQQVLAEINSTRAQFGLYPLTLAEDISQVALKHSLEMACYDRTSHYGLDGMLYNVRLQRDNILFATSNEIIYSGNGGPKGAVKWWMNSPIHKPIVLSDQYTQVGIGFVFYEKNSYQQRITVDFIRP